MATVIIGLAVVLVMLLAVRQLCKDKRKGKSLCGGKCSCCPNGCPCGGKAENEWMQKNMPKAK